ncbi:hypothetical protein WJX73_004857 [Symbiochloris irregularis]|uniref:Uncharacterized protein n=1 Tax=Symbiochloris irregularis TaxID=706552 RepID=A0AAW1NTV9_9CHLO
MGCGVRCWMRSGNDEDGGLGGGVGMAYDWSWMGGWGSGRAGGCGSPFGDGSGNEMRLPGVSGVADVSGPGEGGVEADAARRGAQRGSKRRGYGGGT